MLVVKHLQKRYGDQIVVHDLSFELEKGQTLVLAGSSGSGKTTTLKMINRLVEPSQGEILLDGQLVNKLPLTELRKRMGYVIQTIGLFPHYRVIDNVSVVPHLLKWPEEKAKKRANYLLERLGLNPAIFGQRFPAELSGGQRQRVGIARALAADPPLILMDEPFGALDPITRKALRQDFRNLEELRAKTTILVTHDVEEAFALGDLICLLHNGQVQQLGSPEELLFKPANDYVRDFVGEQFLTLAQQNLQLAELRNDFITGQQDGLAYPSKDSVFSTLSDMTRRRIENAYFDWEGQSYGFDVLALERAVHRRIFDQYRQ